MPDVETLRCEPADRILTLTPNRADSLNALTTRMRRERCAALAATDADDDVRAIIVGAAGRGFRAGFDLSGGAASFDRLGQPPGTDPEALVPGRDGGSVLALRLGGCTEPLIAAVDGAAVGIRVSTQSPTDIRIDLPESCPRRDEPDCKHQETPP